MANLTLTADVDVAGLAALIFAQGLALGQLTLCRRQVAQPAERACLTLPEHAIGSGACTGSCACLELRVGRQTVFGVIIDAPILFSVTQAIISGPSTCPACRKKRAMHNHSQAHK
jgi:hypothetical protein